MWRKDRAWAAAVAAAAILAYANGFAAAFQFDDRFAILDDERLSSAGRFLAALPGMIRPLLKATFLVDRHVYGDDPAGYHVLNLALHCASALLVLAVVRLAVRTAGRGAGPARRSVPLWAALVFAVHPVGTETVTYVSGRATGLASCLALASLFLALTAASPGRSRNASVARGAGAVACFALALLSKETAIVVPGLLLLWRAVVGRAGPGSPAASRPAPGGAMDVRRRDLLSRRIEAACWIVACAAIVAASCYPRYRLLARASLDTRPVAANLLTQVHAVSYGLLLFVCPWRLGFDHDVPIYTSLIQGPLPLDLALLIGLGALALSCLRREPLVTLGLGWFFICVLPTNSVVPRYDVLSERNLYLASIGIVLAAAALVASAADGLRRRWPVAPSMAAAVALALAAALTAATIARNRVYRSEMAFWADAVRGSPGKARPHVNFGYALMKAGDLDRAIAEFRLALAIEPENVAARENLRSAWLARVDRR